MITKTDKLFEHSCRTDTTAGLCRSRGGESCAFDGAMVVLQCIADAAHLVHGPIACLGNSWESRGTVTDKGYLHRVAYTTDLSELDIVYGAEEKLLKAIKATAGDSGAGAIFVYATCVTGLTGEDIGAVCRKAEDDLGVRVVPVHAPGFIGPKNLGNRLAGEALLDFVIGTGAPGRTTPYDINLIGEYNIAGDMQLVMPLLERSGFNVLSRITGNAAFNEITYAHRAKLNVVVCGRALINVAREMERRYGIPYVEVSFFGRTETSRALRAIAHGLRGAGPALSGRAGRVVEEEERRLSARLEAYAGLAGKKAVLYTGGVKSWSFVSALMDLGIEVVAVGTKKSTAFDEEKMKAILGDDAPLYEDMTPKGIMRLMHEKGADILVAGGRNQYLAIKEGFPFVDVNQERHTPYAGYDGLVNLAGQIKSAVDFYNPPTPRHAGLGCRTGKPAPIKRPVSINPLKHSPSIGAAMALQGVDRAMAVLHGAQGCNFLGKVLLTKHFREPISMVSTKLFVEDVVMGSGGRLEDTMEDVLKKNSPDVVGVLTTGLVEVKGEDVGMALSSLDGAGAGVLHIPTPDYRGGLEEGYAAAVEALAGLALPGRPERGRINIIAGSHLTPADVGELREIAEGFGLSPVILPDMSALDGSRSGFSPMASGGVGIGEIREMGRASVTLVLGGSLAGAARRIFINCGVPYVVLEGAAGLAASDALMQAMSDAAGCKVPARYTRQRRVLTDGMRDAMTAFAGRRVALALEADAAAAVSAVISEMGAEVGLAVIPTAGASATKIAATEVLVGDYGAVDGRFDLLVSGSHGELTARRLGVPHFLWGFPVFDTLGHNAKRSVGYMGTLEMINGIGNKMAEVH